MYTSRNKVPSKPGPRQIHTPSNGERLMKNGRRKRTLKAKYHGSVKSAAVGRGAWPTTKQGTRTRQTNDRAMKQKNALILRARFRDFIISPRARESSFQARGTRKASSLQAPSEHISAWFGLCYPLRREDQGKTKRWSLAIGPHRNIWETQQQIGALVTHRITRIIV